MESIDALRFTLWEFGWSKMFTNKLKIWITAGRMWTLQVCFFLLKIGIFLYLVSYLWSSINSMILSENRKKEILYSMIIYVHWTTGTNTLFVNSNIRNLNQVEFNLFWKQKEGLLIWKEDKTKIAKLNWAPKKVRH